MIALNYILVLAGFTLFCALWIKFQLWLKQVDPAQSGFNPGCGACKGGSCSTASATIETTIKAENIFPAKPGFGDSPFGENECEERKSP